MRKLFRGGIVVGIIIVSWMVLHQDTITVQDFGWIIIDSLGGGMMWELTRWLPE